MKVSNVLHDIELERDRAVAAGRAMALELEEKGDTVVELQNEMKQVNTRQRVRDRINWCYNTRSCSKCD